MTNEKRLGVRTLVYSCLSSVLFGIVFIIIASILPKISQGVISSLNLNLDAVQISLINRLGNIIVAIAFLFGFFLILFGTIINFLRYISTTYELSENAFMSSHGLIGKNKILIPYKQIQAVNLNQSVIFRIFGISNLSVLSAGNENGGEKADEIFKIIDVSIAKYLQDELMKKSNIQEVIEVKG